MTTLYKLTDQNGYTRRGLKGATLWIPGKIVTATGTGGLCSSGVIHAYRYPELGVVVNPVHACIRNPRLWLCEGVVTHEDALHVGTKSLTCIAELEVSAISTEACIRWAIYLAREMMVVDAVPEWEEWADAWLRGERSAAWAERATRAAWAAWARTAEAAAWAAWAARAAEGAAEAAWAAKVAWAAEAAAKVARVHEGMGEQLQLLLLQAIGEES